MDDNNPICIELDEDEDSDIINWFYDKDVMKNDENIMINKSEK